MHLRMMLHLKAFHYLHQFICRESCLDLEAVLFIHDFTESLSGSLAEGQNPHFPLLGFGSSNLPLKALSLVSPLPVSSSYSSASSFPPHRCCGSSHSPIFLLLPFTSTRNTCPAFFHTDSPLYSRLVSLRSKLSLRTSLRHLSGHLFHPASKPALVIKTLTFPHPSQHNYLSLRNLTSPD